MFGSNAGSNGGKCGIHFVGGLSFRLFRKVSIDLRGERHGTVAEQLADGLDIDALCNQDGNGAVPEIVESHLRQSRQCEKILKLA
jgi:hypothetical protein